MNYYYKLKKENRSKMKRLRDEDIELIEKIIANAGCFELNPYYGEMIRGELIEIALKGEKSGEKLSFYFYKHPNYLQEYIKTKQIPKRTWKDFVLFEFKNLVGCLTLLWCLIFIFAQNLFSEINIRTFLDAAFVFSMFWWFEKVGIRKFKRYLFQKGIAVSDGINILLFIPIIIAIILVKYVIYIYCPPYLEQSKIYFIVPVIGVVIWGILCFLLRMYIKVLLHKYV